MSIKKIEDGRYEVDIRPTGRNGKRIRRKFQKKHEAIAFERYILTNHKSQEWLPKLKDKRHLSELSEVCTSFAPIKKRSIFKFNSA